MKVAAGVLGPTAFVAAWAIAGARRAGYSPVDDAISRLAEVGASSRPLMNAGFVTFGVAVPTFAVAARQALGPPATAALVVAGLSTLGVAATPLGPGPDTAHGVFAGIGYLAMAAAPVLADRRRGALVSAIAAASLVATTVGPAHGMFQRLGLGVVDAWIVVTALRQRREKRSGAP
ncbi:MAG TPA: DUF998 domain-containing protein [Acidimicrobiales bacterium]|nr:DUF998 domain-containing protein [Acidimicrobiales bacterium]